MKLTNQDDNDLYSLHQKDVWFIYNPKIPWMILQDFRGQIRNYIRNDNHLRVVLFL